MYGTAVGTGLLLLIGHGLLTEFHLLLGFLLPHDVLRMRVALLIHEHRCLRDVLLLVFVLLLALVLLLVPLLLLRPAFALYAV